MKLSRTKPWSSGRTTRRGKRCKRPMARPIFDRLSRVRFCRPATGDGIMGFLWRSRSRVNRAAAISPAIKNRPDRAFEPRGLPDLPGRGIIWPAGLRRLDTGRPPGLCTLALSAGVTRRILAGQGTRRTEPVVVVAVPRLVVVAVGRASVRRLIVERATTQNTATWSSPSGN